MKANVLLAHEKGPLKQLLQTQSYDNTSASQIPLKREISENQNQISFKTLSEISEDEKINIIQTGFQLNQEGKISLKNYYEGVNEVNSLFQLRGYRVKYESIRRTKLYLKFKEEFYKSYHGFSPLQELF